MKRNSLAATAFAIWSVAFSAIAFTACGTRTETTPANVDTTQYSLTTEAGVERDPEMKLADEVDFNGKHYMVTILRAPADSMPQVIDNNDVPFYDNSIRVTVLADGENVVSHTFTKHDFEEAATNLPLPKLVLAGMAFGEINGTGIHFNAQLNTPGSEEGGNNFSITFPIKGGSAKIVAEDIAEDQSSDDDE